MVVIVCQVLIIGSERSEYGYMRDIYSYKILSFSLQVFIFIQKYLHIINIFTERTQIK